MKARRLLVLAGFMGVFAGVSGQKASESMLSADAAALSGLKRLVLPAGYATRPLPAKKDNSRVIYFPGIYDQEVVWNCNQAASIWTMFTYEINYLRNLDASLPENQYSPMAVYNLLRPNLNDPYPGVSYFDSWRLIGANGIPGNPDFTVFSHDQQVWMTGYDKYYHGMKNRVDEVFAIDVGTPEGLLTLKHWLNDHLDGSQVGGVANFQIGSEEMIIPTIPMDKGFEEEGQYIVTRYGPDVGHAMTFVGWNDSVRYDVNGDGRFTNNIDINGDGKVDMKDWEIGAMLVVNSWGAAYNAGKLWVMDRLLAEKVEDGGIWNNAVMVVRPKKTYDPLLTVKANIRYNLRNRIKIQVGVSSDLNSHDPERVMDFPCFNYQGDALPMQGFTGVESDLIEIGLDITPLMNYIPDNGQAKIFLDIIQKSPDISGSGDIESFSVMDYTHGIHEFTSTDGRVPIVRNAVTRLSTSIQTQINRPAILNENLPDAAVGMEYRSQMEADGTTGPYRYANPANQFVERPIEPTFSFAGGTTVYFDSGVTSHVMDLPFAFPFYGTTFNQITILADGGFVMGQNLVKYPYVIDNRLQFYQNKGIFPFFGTLHYPDASKKVTFEASAAETIIRWFATLDQEGNLPVQFAARILADGKIRFYYGNMNITPDISWISGLSAGNNLDYYLMNHNNSGMKMNTAFSLELLDWPSWLSLGSNGDLKGTPDKSGTYTLLFKVTDWTGITNTKSLPLKVTGGSGVAVTELPGTVQVFPNPVTDVIWFKAYADHPGVARISLYDLTGIQVFTRQYQVAAGEVVIPVGEIKSLPAGIYIYQLNGIIKGNGRLIRQ